MEKKSEGTADPRKPLYVKPALVKIGGIMTLTGMYKNLDYLDNTNGSDAYWAFMP